MISKCSKQCGGGRRTRTVSCVFNKTELAHNSICAGYTLQVPANIEQCVGEPCPYWQASRWSDCPIHPCEHHTNANSSGKAKRQRHVVCKLQGEQVAASVCQQLARTLRPHSIEDCPVQTECTEWATSEWSECSVRCGPGGVKTRRVACQFVELGSSKRRDLFQSIAAKNARLGLAVLADDSKCDERHRPANTSECIARDRCPQWRFTQWTNCIGNCTAGVGCRTRSVYCENWDGEGGEGGECDESVRPISRETCDKTCSGEWKAADWSEVCSISAKSKFTHVIT
jgi:hypothetical protein